MQLSQSPVSPLAWAVSPRRRDPGPGSQLAGVSNGHSRWLVIVWPLRGTGGFPVGECHEVAVGCARGVEVVGSFFEFLAQIEHLLFQLADASSECLGVTNASDAAGAEY